MDAGTDRTGDRAGDLVATAAAKLAGARAMIMGCEAFLAVGSSLVVYPAARLPELAAEVGATLLIINREPTPLDTLADLVLRGGCGELLPGLVDALLEAG